MSRTTLTLKSKSKISQPTSAPEITRVIAGRPPKQPEGTSCAALLTRLEELICSKQPTFIQMRYGAGYCGTPTQIQDGWLTLTQATIHGTKQMAQVDAVLIQIRDGSFIAHIHAIQQEPIGEQK
jgi:hypothetical protein